jgi:hypothetical protein
LLSAELITAERGSVSDRCGATDVVRSMARTVGVIGRYAATAAASELRLQLGILYVASNV